MLVLGFLGILFSGAIIFVLGQSYAKKSAASGNLTFYIMGVVALLGLSINTVMETHRNGLPLTSIRAGTYEVEYIYANDNEVNLGISHVDLDHKGSTLYHYLFPQVMFRGVIGGKVSQLVVLDSGNFKYLRLK